MQSQLRDLVVKKHEQVIEEVKVKLAKMKAQNVKFCLTTDEYTSGRNRRYVNVNYHFKGDFFSLGVPRAHGSMPAEKQIELIEARLSKFDLDFAKDIIAISTDGAAVMTKMGKDLLKFYGVEQIICNAHTVHLVVGDIFYKEKKSTVADKNDAINQQVEEEDDDSGNFEFIEGHDETFELKREYKDLVAKVRKVVKMFRKSPVKNEDNLQVYVFRDHGREISLILDICTRWNSMYQMLKRFYEVRKSVENALVDMNERFDFSLEDFETMKDIIDALEPLNLLVLNLCKRDSTLVTAERHIELTMDTLNALGSNIAKLIHESFVERILKRQNTDMIHLIEYLTKPSFLDWKTDSFGEKIDGKSIKAKAIALIKRLFLSEESIRLNVKKWMFMMAKKVHLLSNLLRRDMLKFTESPKCLLKIKLKISLRLSSMK